MRLWAQQSVKLLGLLLCRDINVADQMERYLGKCGVMMPPKFDQVTATVWEVITLLTEMVVLTALVWYSKWLGLLLCYLKCGARLQPICVASHCMGSDYHAFL